MVYVLKKRGIIIFLIFIITIILLVIYNIHLTDELKAIDSDTVEETIEVIKYCPKEEDSKFIDDDGFPVQEYTINISEPIYPNENLTQRENTEMMLNKNFEVWKNIYEEFYGIPLQYSTEN